MNKKAIYKIAPLFIKYCLVNIKALQNRKKRFPKEYDTYLAQYQHLWKADRSVVLDFQKSQLKQLLKECAQYVPYYEEIFKERNIDLETIERFPYAVLQKLPLLPKTVRKENTDRLVNDNPNRPQTGVGFTSGTSGSPMLTYLDKESSTRAFALWGRFHESIGIRPKDKSVRFSGQLIVKPTRNKPPFWIYNKVDKQLFMSTYHLKTGNLPDYIEKLNKFKPDYIDGYPSAVFVLAKFIDQKNTTLKFTPKAICTTAETLYDYQRTIIERSFKCPVFNQYASSEGSPFITECIEGHLHINEDSGVFEFLNTENEPAQPGEIARMVVTSFRSWKTPLLRYDIQDSVLLSKTQSTCSCGCQMPYVEKIIGREDDILWTEEKGFVGRMDTAYKGLKGIVKSQLIQQDKKTLIVNQVVDSTYSEKMNGLLIQNLKDRLGEQIKIKINLMDKIPLGANGKFDAVRREFKIEE